MKKIIYSVMISALALSANAQGFVYRDFSGSMFVQTGILKSKEFSITNSQGVQLPEPYQMDNWCFGVGGKLAFRFNRGIRFGAEGYTSKSVYGDFHSTYNFSWGGLLFDYLYVDRIVSYFAGATLGGGQVVNTLVTERESRDYATSEIMRHRYPVGILNPFAGFEIRISPQLLISAKADYMLNFTSIKEEDWGRGLRMYLGITFRPSETVSDSD